MEIIRGRAIEEYIDALGRFRIEIFREYPYLYDGSLEYEREYLGVYANSDSSILLLLKDENGIVAVCTGIALSDENEDFKKPFDSRDDIFYIGELMIRDDFRGKKLGSKMVDKMLSLIDKDRYKRVIFYTVNRDEALAPQGYFKPDYIWQKLGFKKDKSRKVNFKWKDVGESEETYKEMSLWIKE